MRKASLFFLPLFLILVLSPTRLHAGAGVCIFAFTDFEEAPSLPPAAKGLSVTLPDQLHPLVEKFYDNHEIWGVEFLLRPRVRELAAKYDIPPLLTPAFDSAPTSYTAFLSQDDMITYLITGRIEPAKGSPKELTLKVAIWDCITKHKMGEFEIALPLPDSTSSDVIAKKPEFLVALSSLPPRLTRAIEQYFAQIYSVSADGIVLINAGPESFTKGERFLTYCHNSADEDFEHGPQPHGHKEEDHHFHSPTTLYPNYRPHHFPSASAIHRGQPEKSTSRLAPTTETLQLQETLGTDGKQTGVIEIVEFFRPSQFYPVVHTRARVVEGTVFPGSIITSASDKSAGRASDNPAQRKEGKKQ